MALRSPAALLALARSRCEAATPTPPRALACASVAARRGVPRRRRCMRVAAVLVALAATVAPVASEAAPTAPARRPRSPEPWQQDVVYQIFPRSFADSNDDGVGDLRGILARVPYLAELGVNVVWLNPIYTSHEYDSGYDVSDYLTINPVYGTLEDWTALRDALHARRMKIMMDLVVNHSSDQHPWFLQEVALKRLRHQVAQFIAHTPVADAEGALDLLTNPHFASLPHKGGLKPVRQAIDAFLAADSGRATRMGYPAAEAQLAQVARQLEPCIHRHEACHDVSWPFDDFYLWTNKPNNWTSLFSGSAWHAVEGTGGSVMSLFSVHQVDLNWRNPNLRHAMVDIVQTWQQRGLDGLRIDSTGTLRKDPSFPDAPLPPNGDVRGLKFFTNLPQVHDYLRELAAAYRVAFRTIGEVAFNRPDAPLDYAGPARNELNEVFVFDHIAVDCDGSKWKAKPFDVRAFKRIIGAQQQLIHDRAWLGNYLENHDQLRIVSRYGNDGALRVPSAKLFATLLMTLEGTPYIYQGQEIGMTNLDPAVFRRVEDVSDIEARNYYYAQVKHGANADQTFHQIATRSRDNVRSSMQWSTAAFGGFSAHPPEVWVNDNYRTINVAASLADPTSILHHYRRLISLRHIYPSWTFGTFTDELTDHDKVFAYSRVFGSEHTLVMLNISDAAQTFPLPAETLPMHAKAPIVGNYPDPGQLQSPVALRPWEARIYIGTTTAKKKSTAAGRDTSDLGGS